MILGDFNIYVNDVNDPNASIFLDMMTALGLKQHVNSPNHKSGNCLDLIFTEELSRTKTIKCRQKLFVSDNNSIQCILNSPKEDCTCKEVTYRKLSETDLAQLVNDMSLEMFKAENLDNMVTMLEENISTALNNQAPEVIKVITVRKRNHGLEMSWNYKSEKSTGGKRYSRNADYNLAGLLLTVNENNTKRFYLMPRLHITVHK